MTARSLRMIDIIKKTSLRGTAITRSFMTLSHQRDETRTPTNIDNLIRENLSFLATIVGSRISLEASLESGVNQVIVSPVSALHCVINLLINARDAIADQGTISISTRIIRMSLDEKKYNALDSGDFIVIEVTDTGSGMDDEVLSRAFEPLFSTKANGNGLGLASVLEFARAAGGDACIDSIEGVGSRTYLYLPVVRTPTEQAAWPTDDGTSQSTMPSQRILLVDDEPYALEALSEILEFEGFEVTPCLSAAGALGALEAGFYEVLLTDIVMPDQSGIELARSAQTLQPGIKIILMSGYVPLGEDLEEAWMFIRKPLATKNLIELLRISLSSCR